MGLKYDVEWLRTRVNNGEVLDMVGFWSKTKGMQDEKVFSNFYPSPFEVKLENAPDGVVLNDNGNFEFSCNEQYFQYRKALEFGDTENIVNILQHGLLPKDYKKFGSEVSGVVKSRWDTISFSVMLDGLRYKFTQNEDLKAILLSSEDCILVEAAPRDTNWGIGYTVRNEKWLNPNLWRGKNYLGFALMEIRDELLNT